MDTDNEVQQWAILELMGHKVVAGYISKSEMFGKPMLRVDVPAVGDNPSFTQMYGESAVYCITFVSEEYARQTAEVTRVKPILVFKISHPQLTYQEADEDGEAADHRRAEEYDEDEDPLEFEDEDPLEI